MKKRIQLRESVDWALDAIYSVEQNETITKNEEWLHIVESIFSNMATLKGELESCNLISSLENRPVNPKTGKYYSKRSQKYKEWFAGLSRDDQNWLADREANEWI